MDQGQGRILGHIADAAEMRRDEQLRGAVLPDVPVESNHTGVSAMESGDAAEDRGLTATGRAEQADYRARSLKLGVESERTELRAEADVDPAHRRGVSKRLLRLYTSNSTRKLNNIRPAASVWADVLEERRAEEEARRKFGLKNPR